MLDAARPSQSEMASAIAATLDGHLVGLAAADLTAPPLKGIVAKLGAVTAAVADALATKANRDRGQVLLFAASTHACNAAVVPAMAALTDLTEAGAPWNGEGAIPGTDPIDDRELQRNLGRRFASEAVLKLIEAGWTAEQILNGWIVVTGVAAWDGAELLTIQTETFLQDGTKPLPR